MPAAACCHASRSDASTPRLALGSGNRSVIFGGSGQVPLGHEVRVHVVVCDGAVLVRTGDSVDAKAAARIVVAERHPQPGRGNQQLQGGLAREVAIARGPHVRRTASATSALI